MTSAADPARATPFHRDGPRPAADALRALAIDAVEAARSGHPGLPLGCADLAAALFCDVMSYDAETPGWPDRDRFVLSAGHGSMLLYAALHLLGSPVVTAAELRRFRQLGSRTPGHPENFVTPGIETTTGPLGQGLATAVGMALAERMLNAEFGDGLVDHRTYVLASDGDLMEGVSQEAIALAGHLALDRLIVLFDDNGISIDGPVSLADSVDQVARFESAGWAAVRVDGHDGEAVRAALEAARGSDKPTLIACRTVIGYGAPTRAGTAKSHGEPLGAAEAAAAKAALGWTAAPFEVPDEARAPWLAATQRGRAAREAWEARLAAHPRREAFLARLDPARELDGVGEAMAAFKARLVAERPALASRKASEMTLEAVQPVMPALVPGSADLTGSNYTRPKGLRAVTAGDYSGRYVHYGIREHGMAAAMNGLALHGGFRPAGGTFLVFSDYCRPAIRLAALMAAAPIYVFTHDSIGLGEDGPTHQPVEHLAALRAMPNLLVLRPADAVETAEAWEVALRRRDGPSLLALSRQNLPAFRASAEVNRVAEGAYEVAAAEGGAARASLFATGSEVAVALGARDLLHARGIPARVVSVPSFELFAARPAAERAAVIGDAEVRAGVEAGVRQGWDAVLRADDPFVGMDWFGASAPAGELFARYSITPEGVAGKVLERLA